MLASYARCRERGDFIEAFYNELWARDPDVARRFRNTDMSRQREIMREAINMLIMFARGSAVARMGLERISRVHARGGHDVPPRLYGLFSEVLINTARKRDPSWEPALEHAWRAALAPGLEFMAARY